MKKIKPIYKDAISICYTANDNYIIYLAASITSLALNNRNEKLDIIILYDFFSAENINNLKQLAETYQISIRLYNVKKETKYYSNIQIQKHRQMSTAYRLLLFKHITSGYDKILYLDSDTIINGNLKTLYETDISDYVLAAAPDSLSLKKIQTNNKCIFYKYDKITFKQYYTDYLKMKNPNNYINAGVLLLNLQKCNNYNNLMKQLLDKRYIYNVQDLLNAVFEDDILLLDNTYNYMIHAEATQYEKENPVIIHYIDVKPLDDIFYDTRLNQIFKKYYDKLKSLKIFDIIN